MARDLFRERYRENAEQVAAHAYDVKSIAGLLLCTTKEIMLDDLIERPLEAGDALSNAKY
ncbi:MAG: hypothetical protein R3B91_13915 [Planctomycetaceae bacterium]